MVPPDNDTRVIIDLEHAEREAERVASMLAALRRRHDLTRFEYTRLVRIQPAGRTQSHPILTLGTRFAETEDLLLSTYLHEQMHWYLWRLGGHDHDPIAPFFDELVRRYPQAPITLPEGARSFEQTYLHIVVCWLEIAATSELIGRERAAAVANTTWGYRWIYRTVLHDWEALGALLHEHGILPLKSPAELERSEAPRGTKSPEKLSGGSRRTRTTKRAPRSRQSRRRSRARGGKSAD
ncbi:MAG: hypothetical protein JSS20_11555 [Proteobacteria bacterium]|nr:hypothetical protein [Pseudomonadota bacterium]